MRDNNERAQRAVAILAKWPHIGRVKTRMRGAAPRADHEVLNDTTQDNDPWALTDQQALRLHTWCLDELAERLIPSLKARGAIDGARLFMAGVPPSASRITRWSDTLGALRLQRGAHLGERMWSALNECFTEMTPPQAYRAHDAVIILGTDSPHLDPDILSSGIARLEMTTEPRALIGPADDGGYYTIGCNRAALPQMSSLFSEEIEWGSDRVFEETIRRAQDAGIELVILESSFDLDRPEDLKRLRSLEEACWLRLERALAPHPLAPPTAQPAADQYSEALGWLFGLTRFGERLDLSAPRAMNQALGSPLSHYRNMLIGGTNGKGSTSAALMTLAETSEVRAGCFTSPHLVSFRERIRVGDELIKPLEVVEGVRVVSETAERAGITLSFFEAAWSLAAWYFRERGVDWAVWEVGLGGRLDATNVCEPEVSAIVSLSLDHTHILGDTLEAIAAEKAPIFRAGRPALTGATGEALEALRAVSSTPLITLEDEVTPESLARLTELEREMRQATRAQDEAPNMAHTAHGRANLALAWLIAREAGWHPPEWTNTGRGAWWSRVRWPGRLERLEGIWLDCAHNPDSAQMLAVWLRERGPSLDGVPRHLIIGMSADKDQDAVLRALFVESEQVTLVSPRYPRCMGAEALEQVSMEVLSTLPAEQRPKLKVTPNLSDALRERDLNALQLITGSCFLVGEARAWLLGVPFPEGGITTTAR